jgi:hypothetical protein
VARADIVFIAVNWTKLPAALWRVLFYSGNDGASKAEVAALIDRIGFVGIDLGSLAVGGKLAQFPGGPLPNQDLVKMD